MRIRRPCLFDFESSLLLLLTPPCNTSHDLSRPQVASTQQKERLLIPDLYTVDTLCDDCFQLISLGFMAIGKNNDAPAIYSTVSSIKRLLDHLQEAAFYSSKDLEAMKRELEKHHATLQRCQAEYDPELIELIERRIAVCEEELEHMQKVIHHLTPELAEDWEKLVSILRRLSNLNTRSRYSEKEHAGLKKEIAELEKACPCLKKESPESITTRYNEIISHQQDALNQPPEQLVMDLHERCVLWSSIIENKPLYVDPEFRELYKKLKGIRDSLESRSLLQAWSLRETDLYDFQRQLDRIDESRTLDGNFVDASGKKACLQTQRTLLYFLRKSYALIYMMLTHSEPVSEALLPIYNQLKTLKKCLQEVKKAGGVSSPRELYPYSMKVCHPPFFNHNQHTDMSTAQLHRQHASRRQIHGQRRHSRRTSCRHLAPARLLRVGSPAQGAS